MSKDKALTQLDNASLATDETLIDETLSSDAEDVVDTDKTDEAPADETAADDAADEAEDDAEAELAGKFEDADEGDEAEEASDDADADDAAEDEEVAADEAGDDADDAEEVQARPKFGVLKRSAVKAQDEFSDEEDEEETAGDEADDEAENHDEPDGDEVEPQVATAKVNMYKLLAKSRLLGDSTVELIASAGALTQYYVMVNAQPVAKLAFAKAAADVQSVWNTEVVAKTFLAAVQDEGLTAEVENRYGVEPLVADLPMDEVQKQQVEEAVQDAVEKLEEERKETDAATMQALAVTLVAQTKGMLKMRNPLREALIAKLALAGVEDADEMVDEAFAECGDEQVEEIMSSVRTLRMKTVASLNSIAETVESAGFSRRPGATLAHKLAANSMSVTATVAAPSRVTASAEAPLLNSFFSKLSNR